MNKQIVISGAIGIVIGAVIFSLNWGTNGWVPTMMGGYNNMGDISRHFIEQMVPHHEDAIEMAEIALTKAQHPEIKQLAEDIKRVQSEENESMLGWYKAWYGKDLIDVEYVLGGRMGGGMMRGGMMGDVTDISTLSSAQSFDKEFIEQMIPHHQMAIMMANMVLAGSSRPEIQELAKGIIISQTKEIQSMHDWYKLWYGK